jgi:energy-coupling factor transport system substrate-specific component
MRRKSILIALILVTALAALVVPGIDIPSLNSIFNWGVFAVVLAALICLAFFSEFEKAAVSSKEIALVAMLGTISAVLRIPFAAIPNVQPCTYLIICSGYVFGPIAGFAVGAITAIVSNLFLGHGPWTLYQMIAWGLAGVSAAYLRRFGAGRVWLIIFGIVWGYLYGWIMNIWYWTAFIYPLTLKTFLVYQLTSIWFDTLNAIGNAVLLGLLGTKTIAILEKFRQRFNWRLTSRAPSSFQP